MPVWDEHHQIEIRERGAHREKGLQASGGSFKQKLHRRLRVYAEGTDGSFDSTPPPVVIILNLGTPHLSVEGGYQCIYH